MIKRKGFTLVELLIVIVVIGVLSAMMMLSSTEAVSSAKANNIISNLRNLKTAVLSWYADNIDKVAADGQIVENSTKYYLGTYLSSHTDDFKKYLSNGGSISLEKHGDNTTKGVYCLAGGLNGTDSDKWYVGYRFTNDDGRVKNKIAARAASIGLVQKDETTYTPQGDFVYMRIR